MVGLFKHPKRHLKKLLQDGEYDEAGGTGTNIDHGEITEHGF